MSNELQINDQELIVTLGNSLYVGARPESIKMVLEYCRAAHLDPLQKPVHIVPMNVKNPVTGNYGWHDVIMPGIGHYRIQADRSGTLAGISKPEFGPQETGNFQNKAGNQMNFSYPQWCEVIVKKVVGNAICDFIGHEFWLENYATDSRDSSAPNAMWKKRPHGQLAKCAEAQALRKAFPEIGAQPTAEEMLGKDMYVVENQKQICDQVPEVMITAEQIVEINELIEKTGSDAGRFLGYLNVVTLRDLTGSGYNRAITALNVKAEQNKRAAAARGARE